MSADSEVQILDRDGEVVSNTGLLLPVSDADEQVADRDDRSVLRTVSIERHGLPRDHRPPRRWWCGAGGSLARRVHRPARCAADPPVGGGRRVGAARRRRRVDRCPANDQAAPSLVRRGRRGGRDRGLLGAGARLRNRRGGAAGPRFQPHARRAADVAGTAAAAGAGRSPRVADPADQRHGQRRLAAASPRVGFGDPQRDTRPVFAASCES